MNETIVSTELPQREPGAALRKVRVDELVRGDWVAPMEFFDPQPAEIRHVEINNDRATVIYRLSHETMLQTADVAASRQIELADPEQVTRAKLVLRRRQVIDGLMDVARLIDDRMLSVGGEFGAASISIPAVDLDDLQAMAEALELPVKSSGFTRTVTCKLGFAQVQWHAYVDEVARDPLGQLYSREEPAIGTAPVPEHVQGEAMTGRGPNTAQITRFFSFGDGHTDPDTGEDLWGKYVTVVGPDSEACRVAMLASKYGRAWSFEYGFDPEVWAKVSATWTEHDRIVVGADEAESEAS